MAISLEARPAWRQGNSGREDEVLLTRITAKDRRAFESLYHRYYRRLFGYIFKVTRRAEMVEEILNDVMFVVWQDAGRFDGRSRVSSWILGIAYRKALKALSRLPAASEPPSADTPLETRGDGPESLLVRREQATVLGRALAALPPEQRAVVELTYFHERSYKEIAEIVGCPVNTVKTRMFHARRRLRAALPGMGVSEANP